MVKDRGDASQPFQQQALVAVIMARSGRHKPGVKRKSGSHKPKRDRGEAGKRKEAERHKASRDAEKAAVKALRTRVLELESQLATAVARAAAAGGRCLHCKAMEKRLLACEKSNKWLKNALEGAEQELLAERNLRLRMEAQTPSPFKSFIR